MAKAVLIDLCSSWSAQTPESVAKTLEAVQEEESFHNQFVYIMCYHTIKNERNERNGEDAHHKIMQSFHCPEKGVEVVSSPSVVAALYTVKQKLDERSIDTIKIILASKRKPSLTAYVKQLFTSVYQFEFKDLQINCEEINLKNRTIPQCELVQLTDQDVQKVESEIALFLKCLPSLKGKLTILKSYLIPDHIFLHGFTTRTGGISYIPTLSSLNLFSSSKRRDPPAVVKENLRRLAAAAGFNQDEYHTIKVNHASDVWVMGKAQPKSFDALVTNQKGVTIAAPGADCIPILFADPVQKACGAAHSGWLGTLLGVSMAVVHAMIKEYGSNVEDILVVLGPSVGPCCFRLPQESAKEFHKIDPKCVRDFEASHPYIDLRRATRVLLEAGGILSQNIQDDTVKDQNQNLTLCTSCCPDRFYSHVSGSGVMAAGLEMFRCSPKEFYGLQHFIFRMLST